MFCANEKIDLLIKDKARISILETKADKNDQECISTELILSGPCVMDINPDIKTITGLLNIEVLPPTNIPSIKKIQFGKQKAIIIKCGDTDTKAKLLKAKTSLRGKGMYLQENLTQTKRLLLKSTKDIAKTIGYKFVWTKDGNILARKTEDSAPIHIHCTNDLQNIK